MRHGTSLLVSLEGMSRAAFRMASELANNSRAGLTVRFLSKKLELPEEEVEYLIDVNGRLMFTDLTKVKLVPEGAGLVKRIQDGMENRGDIGAVQRQVRGVNAHDFRRLEEQLDLPQPTTKKAAAEILVERCYYTPDAIVEFVATRGFSQTAQELFDLVWQSRDGIMPVSKLRLAHGGSEYEVEQALLELLRSCALFELFRFDSEERLVRAVALLAELRQWRNSNTKSQSRKNKLKALRTAPEPRQRRAIELSERLCRLVAALAARPARLRGDGDLFREDRRRLAEIVPEESEPSLTTCLWVAEGLGWLSQVDNTLRAGALDELLPLGRTARHRLVYRWMLERGDEADARKTLHSLIDDAGVERWYPVTSFVRYAVSQTDASEEAVLRQSGGHWAYQSPSASGQLEARLARALEETLFWLGVVDRATVDGESVFCVTQLGAALLREHEDPTLDEQFPPHKCEFVVQPNFDIVVASEDMDPLLTVPLDRFAVRTSTGAATVYHLSKDSFTQALQEGHDGDAFVSFLVQYNRGAELPRNVTTTLEDWRGGMKRVRLRTVHVLESDDPLVVADLMHRNRLNKHFEAVDSKRLVRCRDFDRNELGRLLEKEGFIVE